MYHEMILQTEIKVELKDCTNLNKYILKKLKKNEGLCISNGYVKKDSIDIVSRSIGKTTIYNNTSDIYYNVHFKAKICNPQKNDIIQCKMKRSNKMGILADAIYEEE